MNKTTPTTHQLKHLTIQFNVEHKAILAFIPQMDKTATAAVPVTMEALLASAELLHHMGTDMGFTDEKGKTLALCVRKLNPVKVWYRRMKSRAAFRAEKRLVAK